VNKQLKNRQMNDNCLQVWTGLNEKQDLKRKKNFEFYIFDKNNWEIQHSMLL